MSDRDPARGYQDLDLTDSEPLTYHPGPSIMSVTLTPLEKPGDGYTLVATARLIGAGPWDLDAVVRALAQARDQQHRHLRRGRPARIIDRTITITMADSVGAEPDAGQTTEQSPD